MSQQIIKIKDDIIGGENILLKDVITTSLTSGSTDEEIPSAKTVFDELELKVDKNGTDRLVSTSEISAWNGKQDALGFTPENSANKATTITGNETSTTKFPVIKAILDYFTQSKLFTILGISTLSGSNTGDETQSTIKTKLGAATASVDGYATSTQITKLDGIAAGAEVNVNSDWNTSSGDAQILNKPTLGTAAAKNIPATGNASATEVVYGNDTRLHAAGSDAETNASIDTLINAATEQTTIPNDTDKIPLGKTSTFNFIQYGTFKTWFITAAQTVSQTIGDTTHRLTKLWATDIESTNMPTVGGTSLATTFAPASVYPSTGLTTGKIPYKSASVLADSPIYTDGTNVGIGTMVPGHPIDVIGVIGAGYGVGNGEIRSYQDTNLDASSPHYISFRTDTVAGKSGIFRSNTNFFTYYDTNTGDTNLDATFADSSDIFRIGGVEKMRVSNNGNVGIGITEPKSKCDVNGGVRVADDTDAASADKAGTMRYRETSNNSYYEVCVKNGASSYIWKAINIETW